MRTPRPGAASAPRGPPGERKRGAPAPADAAVASSPKALPPRVVVELPDGGVYLGEDDARLEGERQETAQHLESVRRQAALPGTERFLELRRLLYATALETLVVTRKRHVAVLLSAPPPPACNRMHCRKRALPLCTSPRTRATQPFSFASLQTAALPAALAQVWS